MPGVRAAVLKWAQAWARKRQGPDHAPVRLARRRVYILPTRFGAIYASIVLAMLLASMNYNNSLGFALTFLLTGLGLVVMHHCHRNLLGVTVSGVQTGEAFAGELMQLQVGLANPTALWHYEIHVGCVIGDQGEDVRPTVVSSIAPAARALANLQIPTERRGALHIERLTVSTRFPLGLFRAWSWVYLPLDAWVYPHPSGHQSPAADSIVERGSYLLRRGGTEEFHGFRSYVPGDSPRHIAWKALARGAPLMVKDYAGAQRAPLLFDFAAVQGQDTESRLSQLCRWVLDADRSARMFGLKLPRLHIPVRSGAAQRRRCLEALASFGASGSNDG